MPIIEERAEDAGTIYLDKIKVELGEQLKRRESEIQSERRQLQKAADMRVPRSVDVLLKK